MRRNRKEGKKERKNTKRGKRKERRLQKENLSLTSLIYVMTRITQWSYKGLRARHEEVGLLMKGFQPSCISI